MAATASAFAAAYALIGLFRHWRLGSGYDLGIFDQAIWSMSRFEAPHELQHLHGVYKDRIHQFTMGHFFPSYTFDLDRTLYMFTSGS